MFSSISNLFFSVCVCVLLLWCIRCGLQLIVTWQWIVCVCVLGQKPIVSPRGTHSNGKWKCILIYSNSGQNWSHIPPKMKGLKNNNHIELAHVLYMDHFAFEADDESHYVGADKIEWQKRGKKPNDLWKWKVKNKHVFNRTICVGFGKTHQLLAISPIRIRKKICSLNTNRHKFTIVRTFTRYHRISHEIETTE